MYPLDLSYSSPAEVPPAVAADRHYAGLPPFDIASGGLPPAAPSVRSHTAEWHMETEQGGAQWDGGSEEREPAAGRGAEAGG